jgi:hypothetical protein
LLLGPHGDPFRDGHHALILIEKVGPSRRWISQAIGLAFICIGAIVAMQPAVLLRLSSHVILAN